LAVLLVAATAVSAQPAASTNAPAWLTEPLALVEAINVALENNGAVRQARADLEATHGVIVQTRAIAYPRVRVQGNYEATDAIESLEFPPASGIPDLSFENDQRWSASIRVIQSLYEGGRISSSRRIARLTKEQSLA
jgi:outer membrane protein TolC